MLRTRYRICHCLAGIILATWLGIAGLLVAGLGSHPVLAAEVAVHAQSGDLQFLQQCLKLFDLRQIVGTLAAERLALLLDRRQKKS